MSTLLKGGPQEVLTCLEGGGGGGVQQVVFSTI